MSELENQASGASAHRGGDTETETPTPGKRTRTQDQIAARGVSGSGEPMPFRKLIQKSFGKHDISNVRTYRDDRAKQANRELGAEAYVTGNRMALFSDAPDLHTVAHEAAHVVQQREGVAFKGGATYDAHERHADQVADAVVGGRSAESLLDTMAGSTAPRVQKKAASHSHTPPQGVLAFSVTIADATLSFLTDGERLVIDLHAGDDHAVVVIDAQQLLKQLAGEIALDIQRIKDLIHQFKEQVKPQGSLIRIPLGGAADKPNFVVIDLKRVATSVGSGTLDLRPVEAQLTAGPVGLKVFANQQVKENQAIPGDPIGGWFEIPDDGQIRHALGVDGAGSVWAGVFYDDGHLRVAVKPTEKAHTGIVGDIDVLALLEQLKKLGSKIATWLGKLSAHLKGKLGSGLDWLSQLAGKLKFSLPEMNGSWLEFDLKLQLPKLWRGGGGFHFPDLLPTNFHIDFGGLSLGALPKLKFPWLHAPKLGSFSLPFGKLQGLLGSLSLPHLSLPKLPEFNFDLHLAGNFKLGLGIDLSALGAEFRDLAFGIEIDLLAILQKIGAAGTWLLDKLRGAKDWVLKWIHLGNDGVLRIFDGDDNNDNKPMVGFHLLRLLDGADATDLVPTELRWHPPGDNNSPVGIELGETGNPIGPNGRAAPQKPAGALVVDQPHLRLGSLGPHVATALALKPNATVHGSVYSSGTYVTLWAEAASSVYDHPQAMKTTFDVATIATFIAKHLPPGRKTKGLPTIELDVAASKKLQMPRFNIVPDKVGAVGSVGPVHGYVAWKLERVLGAQDWTDLVPDELSVEGDGMGKLELGTLHPPSAPLFDTLLPVPGEAIRRDLFHVDPVAHDGQIWLGAYRDGPNVAVSASPDDTGKTGALVQVNVEFLLAQLKKLGKLGEKIVSKLGSLFHLPDFKPGSGDLWGKLSALARKIVEKLKGLGSKLHIDFGAGNWLAWDLKLPHLGVDLDFSNLLPEFHFDFPDINVSLDFNLDIDVKWPGLLPGEFELPSLHLKELLGGFPDLHLGDTFKFALHILDDLTFGLSFNVGGRGFGLKFPFKAIKNALAKAKAWLDKKWQSAKDLAGWYHLGHDGVLRIYEPGKPEGDRVGFDLMQLLKPDVGFDALIPSELHIAAGGTAKDPVAELSVGTTDVKGKHETGTVVVPKPTGELIAEDHFEAPEWLREHLGVGPKARLYAALILGKASASAYASVEGSDRGAEITVHEAVLAKLGKMIKPPNKPALGKLALAIDAAMSLQHKMLMVSFKAGSVHGFAGWNVRKLLHSPTLEALDPDALLFEGDGMAKLELGDIHPPGAPLFGQLVPVPGEAIRRELFHVDPAAHDGQIWLAAYKSGADVAISASPDDTGKTGALVQVNLEFLLAQLKKLGKLGARIVDKLGSLLKLPNWKAGSADPWGRLAEIARRLIDKLKGLGSKLHIDFGSGNWLAWDLKLPHLGVDLDFSNLLPEFHFDLPDGISLDFNLDIDVTWPSLLPGSFELPALHLKDLLGGFPDFNLGDKFRFALHLLDDMTFGLSFDLGGRGFGIRFPFKAIRDALDKAKAWLNEKWQSAKGFKDWYHLGHDGVLRIYEPGKPDGDRVGFDLMQLLKPDVGFDALIPSELHLGFGGTPKDPAAELSVGTTNVKGKHDDGTVLVPKPSGDVIGEDRFEAPEWLRDHLGVPPKSRVYAALILGKNGATAYASVEGSDRGAEITIHQGALAQMAKTINLAKMPATDAIKIDTTASAKSRMLIVSFQAGSMHGYAGWKAKSLLHSPLLEALTPDELSLGVGHSRLVLKELDLKDVHPRGTISTSTIPTIEEVLGKGDVTVYTNDFGLDRDAHIAIAKAGAKDPRPMGVELDIGHELVAKLRHGFDTAINDASSAIGRALHRTKAAGLTAAGKLGIEIKATSRGILIHRGEETDPRYLYALYGWQHLSTLIANAESGQFDLKSLAPDEWRVSTNAMSLEVTASDNPSRVPESAHPVKALHPILKDSLKALGLQDDQRVDLDLEKSRIADERGTHISAVGHVYTMDAAGKLATHTTQIKFGTTVEAILAQVLPMKRAWKGKGVKAKDPGAGHTSVAAGITPVRDASDNVEGVGMAVDVLHRNQKGDKREFHVEVGWTLHQLLDMLMHYNDVFDDDGLPKSDAASYLIPDRFSGSFETEKFKVTIANTGSASKYNCHASDLPGFEAVLEAVLDKAAAQSAMLHLNIPSASLLAKEFTGAGHWIPLAGCALELPTPSGTSKFYSVMLEVSPWILKKLLYLIPVAGEVIALIDKAAQILKDPVETFNEFRYAPEILGDLIENRSEIWDTMKEKGWKGVALALVMGGDVSTKQGVFAGRIHKKMKAAGWKKKGDKKTGDIADVPEEYLEWLSQQDGDALVALYELGEASKAKGVPVPDEADYSHPDHPLSVADIELKKLMVENSYIYFESVKKSSNPNDPASQAKVAQAAEKTRATITMLIKSGARQSALADPNTKGVDAEARTTDATYSDITKLPSPSPEDEEAVRKMFTNEKLEGGTVMSSVEIDYLIKKYASRTTDELASLLATGTLIVDGVPMTLTEPERPFVRALFSKKAHLVKGNDKTKDDPSKTPTGSSNGKDPTAEDQKLVAAYQAKRAADAHAVTNNKHRAVGKGKKKKGDGEGEGDMAEADLDAAFGDEELDHASGDGQDAGQSDGADAAKAPKDKKKTKDKDKADPDAQTAVTHAKDAPASKDAKHDPPRAIREVFGALFKPAFARQRVIIEPGNPIVKPNTEQLTSDMVHPAQFVDDNGSVIEVTGISANGHRISDEHDPDPYYEIVVAVSFKHADPANAYPIQSTTYTFYTHQDKTGDWNTREKGVDDAAGLGKKFHAAIVWNGSAFVPQSSRATFDHGAYTITVVGIKNWQPLDSKRPDAYEADVEIHLDKANNASGTLIVKQPDGESKVLRVGDSGTMRLPVWKK